MIINAYELKAGDVFIINGERMVAIGRLIEDVLWVTTEEYYLTGDKGYKFVYGYTNSSVLQIQAHDKVELIKNIENNTR